MGQMQRSKLVYVYMTNSDSSSTLEIWTCTHLDTALTVGWTTNTTATRVPKFCWPINWLIGLSGKPHSIHLPPMYWLLLSSWYSEDGTAIDNPHIFWKCRFSNVNSPCCGSQVLARQVLKRPTWAKSFPGIGWYSYHRSKSDKGRQQMYYCILNLTKLSARVCLFCFSLQAILARFLLSRDPEQNKQSKADGWNCTLLWKRGVLVPVDIRRSS